MNNRYQLHRFLFLLLFIILSVWACKKESLRKVSPAFYYWKQSFELSPVMSKRLEALDIQKIYLRFFDVDWDGQQAVPLSIMTKKAELPASISIVPTVFITNRTILNTKQNNIADLADKILSKLEQLSQAFHKDQISEVQFDCDWSQQSKARYFQLLTFLKTKLAQQGIKISATIRLHQIKYYKTTGVPDVDRGVLMFYNMDDIDQLKTPNSIINIPLAKNYLAHAKQYPLQLDIALPIFKWGLVFQEEKLVKIINNLDQADLKDTEHFDKISQNQFEVSKSTYLQGYYIYKGDKVKLESVPLDTLKAAADLLNKSVENNELNIIFYHLDSIQIADYSNEALQDIYHRFY